MTSNVKQTDTVLKNIMSVMDIITVLMDKMKKPVVGCVMIIFSALLAMSLNVTRFQKYIVSIVIGQ